MRTLSSFLRTAGHLLGVAGSAAFVIVAVLGAASMVFVGIGPWTGAYRTLTVLSGSMRPMITPGDVVVVRPVPTSHLREGDVIAFSAPTPAKETVTHRIIEVVEPGASPVVRTQGDNNNTPDPWQAKLTAGTGWRVVGVVPLIGRGINVLSRPDVRDVASKALPAALAVVWIASLIPMWREGDEDPEEADGGGTVARPPRPPARVLMAVGACLALGVVLAPHASPGRRRGA